MAVVVMLVLMFALLFLGVPVGVCLILPIVPLVYMTKVTSMTFISNIMYSGVASYTLIALPFFIIAGNIMDCGGLSRRLIRIANSLSGRTTGSLGMVAILACMFFGAVSGSSVATVAAIGSIMLPEMVRNGYNKYYAAALITVAGCLGVIVPPSFPMVVYGVTMNVSIGDIFIGGIGPAILVGLIMMSINYFYAKRTNCAVPRLFPGRKSAPQSRTAGPPSLCLLSSSAVFTAVYLLQLRLPLSQRFTVFSLAVSIIVNFPSVRCLLSSAKQEPLPVVPCLH